MKRAVLISFLALLSLTIMAQNTVLKANYPANHDLVKVSDGGSLTQEVTQESTEGVVLYPSEDIQEAIDALASVGGGLITLRPGVYMLSKSLTIYSDITLQGDSSVNASDVVITPSDSTFKTAIITSTVGIHNVTFRNFTVQGNLADSEMHFPKEYHSEGLINDGDYRNDMIGILLTAGGSSYAEAESSNISMDGVEVTKCSMGIHIKGARDVYMTNMNVFNNGMIEAYYHNLYFRRVFMFTIENSTFSNSTTGNGMNVSQSTDVTLRNNDCHDNYFRGLRVEGESGTRISNVLITSNRCTGNGLTSGQPGIRCRNTDGGTISSNTASNNGSDPNFAGNTGLTITGNSWQ